MCLNWIEALRPRADCTSMFWLAGAAYHPFVGQIVELYRNRLAKESCRELIPLCRHRQEKFTESAFATIIRVPDLLILLSAFNLLKSSKADNMDEECSDSETADELSVSGLILVYFALNFAWDICICRDAALRGCGDALLLVPADNHVLCLCDWGGAWLAAAVAVGATARSRIPAMRFRDMCRDIL